jgi:TRAP-type C4-dicarboxylate transport system permease small subunit
MKYPKFMSKLNAALAVAAGALVMLIALLAVMEGVLRSVFSSPTIWSVDISAYLLIIAAFFGSSYAYQEQGHVAVDFMKGIVEKHGGKTPRRAMSIAGYVLSFAVVFAFLWTAGILGLKAVRFHSLTTNNVQVPMSVIYGVMALGSLVMLFTVFFIILDLFSDSEQYL